MMIMGFSVVNVFIQCFLLHTKMMINTKNKKSALYIFKDLLVKLPSESKFIPKYNKKY